ncbi:hypothetical protein [Janthinobacterium aquaticum]|uniref:hypothetical protein n=1 Tax=Janthinobacterium sp. FT58W TaxID=2654254 RepID=UPI00126509A1|nr:hypothetical protein [Janthinobacterium sp. FT58W]KAB8042558.1 hypothetical protein GCM43_13620 [Janthinobacterium sp. FT58W]
MKLIAKQDFSWAHGGSDVRQYAKGDRIETDDADMTRVALDEGWAEVGDWEDPIPVREPTKEELLAARDALLRREAELQEQAERLDKQAAANQAEADRLAQLADSYAADGARLAEATKQLAADRAAFDAAKAAAPAPTTGKGKDKAAA